MLQLDAAGRPDESLAVEIVGPLQPSGEDTPQNGKLMSFSLQKGQLKANVCFRPLHSVNLEVLKTMRCLELMGFHGVLTANQMCLKI